MGHRLNALPITRHIKSSLPMNPTIAIYWRDLQKSKKCIWSRYHTISITYIWYAMHNV